jgi:hypothetical protein
MNADRVKQCLAGIGFLVLLLSAWGHARAQMPDPTRFGAAIETGDIRAARNWLEAGLPPDFLGDRIGTGLMIAAWEGNIPMMELFVAHGANVNARNAVQEQALMHAAWRGRLDAVRWLLARGAQINQNGLAWSALHYAVFAGHEDVAKFLIERGANINARSTNGSSVLMMAAREGQVGIAQMLVEMGADTKVKNDWGDDALVWAMRHRHFKIAKMVTSPEQFAAAAQKPAEAWGEPQRSRPVPDRMADLIEEMRRAEARGRISPELQQAYLLMVADLRRKSREEAAAAQAAREETPKALEITARRAAPGEEKATLIYEQPAPRNPFAEPGGAPLPVQR